jgi:hypothetical protein
LELESKANARGKKKRKNAPSASHQRSPNLALGPQHHRVIPRPTDARQLHRDGANTAGARPIATLLSPCSNMAGDALTATRQL